jgi:hypothetical protein
VTTVLALLNAQFGGSIMVLPLLALRVGWLPMLLIVLATVVANWYSCHLVLLHLGDEQDVGKVVSNHFSSRLPIRAYNLAAALGLLTACMVYFKLVVIQVEGLLLGGEHTPANALANGGLLLVWLVATKCWDIDTHISGYGFFSIVSFFLFLLWATLASPPGSSELPLWGTDLTSFTAIMNNALTIQFIFVPILKSYPFRERYSCIMLATFLITMVFYYYINAVGALSTSSPTQASATGRARGSRRPSRTSFRPEIGRWP